MSYILDALKKSEQERQQGSGPTLQTVHQPAMTAKPSRSGWMIAILSGLLSLTVLMALFFHLRGDIATPSEVATATSVQSEPVKIKPAATAIATETTAAPAIEDAAPLPVVEMWELPEEVQTALPALTFSFHVYSDNPGRRTIIINKRRVKEGSLISDQLKLLEITTDGVIMQWQQHRFHIAVVEAW